MLYVVVVLLAGAGQGGEHDPVQPTWPLRSGVRVDQLWAEVTRRRRRRRASRPDWSSRIIAGLLTAALAAVVVGPWVRQHLWVVWLAAAMVVLALAGWLRLRWLRRLRELELTRSIAVTDGMTGTEFELWTAQLMRRDGFRKVEVSGGAGDCGADITAVTPAGARTVVQCKRYAEHRKVSSPDLQRFAGTVFALHEAELALLVTTGGITAPAAELAARLGITVVARPQLSRWAAHGRAPFLDTPLRR